VQNYLTQRSGFYGTGMGNDFGMMQAASPFDPRFQLPGGRNKDKPLLPGEDRKNIDDVYGPGQPQPMPGAPGFPQLPMAGSPFGSSNLYGAMAQMGGRYDPSAPGNGAAMSNLPNGANAANATFYRGLPPGYTKTVS
jgi:hypothetical protein